MFYIISKAFSYYQIYSGESVINATQKLAEVCGGHNRWSITSSKNVIKMIFKSEDLSENGGFTATYRTVGTIPAEGNNSRALFRSDNKFMHFLIYVQYLALAAFKSNALSYYLLLLSI